MERVFLPDNCFLAASRPRYRTKEDLPRTCGGPTPIEPHDTRPRGLAPDPAAVPARRRWAWRMHIAGEIGRLPADRAGWVARLPTVSALADRSGPAPGS